MNTVKVFQFTIRDKEDNKRYLMELTGEPKSTSEFKEAFSSPEDFDFRTIRWIGEYQKVSNYQGVNVELVYDSNDNPFVEM